eukprot:12067016-Heterocapsa_arctica.AAC.1
MDAGESRVDGAKAQCKMDGAASKASCCGGPTPRGERAQARQVAAQAEQAAQDGWDKRDDPGAGASGGAAMTAMA